jgi:hypothetical protein
MHPAGVCIWNVHVKFTNLTPLSSAISAVQVFQPYSPVGFRQGIPDLKAHFSFRTMSWPVPRQAPVSLPTFVLLYRVPNLIHIHHTYWP